MKLTRHNGRAGKNGVYNPRHNDRSFDVSGSEHIDEERMKKNIYWDYYHGYSSWESRNENNKEELALRFEEVEKMFYFDQYYFFCAEQHERNRKSGHSIRDRSTEDLRLSRKTCPEESLIQIGTREDHVSAETLFSIATEFFEEYQKRFGAHVHILNWGLHLDEATPHIHERHVFDCENKYGEIAPQQEKALEKLDIPLPFPDKPNSKTNNRKVMFDSICRTMLFDICKKHDLHLDEEPEYGGREYLEKQDFILMKQKTKIEEQEKKLDMLMLKIEDTETFIEEVSDAAYEKAVDAVTEVVRQKTLAENLQVVENYVQEITVDSKLSDKVKNNVSKALRNVQIRMKRAAQGIQDKIRAALMDPEEKVQNLKPVKEVVRKSIHQRMQENKRLLEKFDRKKQEENMKQKKQDQAL